MDMTAVLSVILFTAGLVTGAAVMLCHCRNERRRVGRAKAASKRLNKMDIILIIVAVTSIVFVAVMIWLYDRHQNIPETLIISWFTAVAGEMSICGWIKSAKEKNRLEEK